MADYTAKRIDEMESVYGDLFVRARAELGVTSFGMQVFRFPPNFEQHPEHDHAEEGQEEVYVTLSGRGELTVDGDSVTLEPDVMVRAGPAARRKIVTGDEPLVLLALGGFPGRAYEGKEISELGVPDPLAQASS
jgi:mannose-6-phosphate isomerase-like protein (cupin superfamily)